MSFVPYSNYKCIPFFARYFYLGCGFNHSSLLTLMTLLKSCKQACPSLHSQAPHKRYPVPSYCAVKGIDDPRAWRVLAQGG